MLRNIPDIISPALMKTIMDMGHGDEICFADANFPSETMGQRVVRADGLKIPDLLTAVLQFLPLDVYVKQPVVLMDAPEGESPRVWAVYDEIIKKHDFTKAHTDYDKMERFAFYERSKRCFAVVATSEYEGYSNIILKKGVIFK